MQKRIRYKKKNIATSVTNNAIVKTQIVKNVSVEILDEPLSTFTPLLEAMVSKLLFTKIEEQGFPIAAVFYNDKKIIDSEVNRKSVSGKPNDYNNHCETIIVHRHALDGIRWCNLLVTIPSCIDCLRLLLKTKSGIKNIYYLDLTGSTIITKGHQALLDNNGINLLKLDYAALDILGKIFWTYLVYKIKEMHHRYKSSIDNDVTRELELSIECRRLLSKYDDLVKAYLDNTKKLNKEKNKIFIQLDKAMISEKMTW